MTYLVTGGAGFIGSHLVEHLVRDGQRVRVIDDFSTGKRENLAAFAESMELIEGTVADSGDCARACADVEVVLHQAAIPSVPRSVEDPVASHRANAEGTFNLLVAARDSGVRRFVYAASSSAYGETPQLPKDESIPPDPLSPYGVQKLNGEQYCTVFSRCYGLDTISLRYFNVFGPRQDPKSQYAAAIPAFITAMLRGEAPRVYGDGEQTRDFTYIENVIHANMLAARAERTAGAVVNIACGERISVNEVIARINEILGTSVSANHADERAGDIKHSWASIDRAAALIGFRPTVSFSDGLRRTIDWYRESVGGGR